MAVAESFGRVRAKSENATQAELLSIQYLRALAAIAVVLFHTAKVTHHSFHSGAAGVDVFFVISGFIMWVIGRRYLAQPGRFLVKRAGRIVPLYWFLTLAMVALDIALPGVFHSDRLSAGHLATSLFFIPAYGAPLIVAGWTLNFEVLFYLLFAASLLLAARAQLFALSAIISALVLFGWLVHPMNAILATVTDPLLLEFLFGIWLGKAWSEGLRLSPGAGAAMLAIALGAIAYVQWLAIYAEAVRVLVWGIPALMIVAGAVALEPVRNSQSLKFLGDASYSIYLVHGTVVALCVSALTSLRLTPGPLVFGLAASGGIAAGCLCHVLVERPLLKVFHPSRRGPAADSARAGSRTHSLPVGGIASQSDPA